MKKMLIAALIAVALGVLFWRMIRRTPGGPPPEETRASFTIEKAGTGTLLCFQESRIPLRGFRWVFSRSGRWLASQIITQSNRQQIVLFKDGYQVEDLFIPRPAGVKEGFFNFAELRDLVVVPNDVMILLYLPANPDGSELPLVIAIDLKTKETRWIHRAPGTRLALASDSKEDAVFLFGTKDPIVRLPINIQKGEKASNSLIRAFSKSIELPPEIPEVSNLLPTGSWTFLIAHKGGLSAYQGSQGWVHNPMPETRERRFKDSWSALARGNKRIWWQPWPGIILQVLANGSAVSTWNADCFPLPEPFTLDAKMVRFLGCDPDGKLWFALTAPDLTLVTAPSPSVVPTHAEDPAGTPPSEKPPSTQTPPLPEPPSPSMDPALREALQAHIDRGLDRLYCWDPLQRTLQRFVWTEAWSSLLPPSCVSLPRGDGNLDPSQGALALPSNRCLWWLPLRYLPLSNPIQTNKASDTDSAETAHLTIPTQPLRDKDRP